MVMANQGRKPNGKVDSNVFLPGDMEDSASIRRNMEGQNDRILNKNPPLEDEGDRIDGEDSESSKSDETHGSAIDASSVASDTSSGAESIGAVLQGKKEASSSYFGKIYR